MAPAYRARGGMTDETRTATFTDALQQFEKDGDVGPFRALFADSAEFVRPEGGRGTPTEVDAFWESYRTQFSEISTEFTHVQEAGDVAALEWVSRGKLAAGRDIDYHGVSLLTYDGEGKVSRFATYYDTVPFVQPQA